jgi:choline monooxygenase
MARVTADDVRRVAIGYDPDPARSMSLRSEAYTDPLWSEADLEAIFARTWQWICHVEKLAEPGNYVSATIAEMPIVVVRDRAGGLRAFYNVF